MSKEVEVKAEEAKSKKTVEKEFVKLGEFDKLTEGAGAQYVDGRKNSERQ